MYVYVYIYLYIYIYLYLHTHTHTTFMHHVRCVAVFECMIQRLPGKTSEALSFEAQKGQQRRPQFFICHWHATTKSNKGWQNVTNCNLCPETCFCKDGLKILGFWQERFAGWDKLPLQMNKRLWSEETWRNTLRRAGFDCASNHYQSHPIICWHVHPSASTALVDSVDLDHPWS